jgi:anti-anti-sigma factor
VIIDLSGVEFMDSSGLHALVALQEDARDDGWRMELDPAVSAPVARLIELTGVRPLFDWQT